jgi:hypothetical protein
MIKNHSDAKRLIEEGKKIKKQIQEIGVSPASIVFIWKKISIQR